MATYSPASSTHVSVISRACEPPPATWILMRPPGVIFLPLWYLKGGGLIRG
jgi:hypothetical protein